MQRKPNEVQISPEVLERLFSEGEGRRFRVTNGPAGDAKITDARFDREHGFIVLEYDQEVPEPVCLVTE